MNIRKSKKLALVALIIALLCAAQAGCSRSSESDSIKIGIVGTMTGENSDLSVSGRRGAEIAVSEINNAGGVNGKKLELVVKDDKNNAQTALSVDKQFVEENVKIIIGHYISGMIVGAMDYIKKQPVLFLSPTISADTLLGRDDNFIRFIATTKEQAVILAKCAREKGDKKLGVVYDINNKAFCEPFYENYKKLVEGSGGKVLLTKTFSSQSDKDYSELAAQVDKAKLDGVFIIADAIHNAAITQQIKKLGSKLHIYAPLWANTPDLFRKGGIATEGMFIVGAIDLNDPGEKFSSFKKSFLETYGENPTFSSIYSYETVYALFDAMKNGNYEPETVKKYIIDTKNFSGLEGNYQIDKYGDNLRSYIIFEITKDSLRKVDLHE